MRIPRNIVTIILHLRPDQTGNGISCLLDKGLATGIGLRRCLVFSLAQGADFSGKFQKILQMGKGRTAGGMMGGETLGVVGRQMGGKIPVLVKSAVDPAAQVFFP